MYIARCIVPPRYNNVNRPSRGGIPTRGRTLTIIFNAIRCPAAGGIGQGQRSARRDRRGALRARQRYEGSLHVEEERDAKETHVRGG